MEKFHNMAKLALRAALVGCVLFVGSQSMEAKPKKKATPTPTPEDKPLDVPIPIGHQASGVRIPVYDAAGKLQMIFESEIAFRLDLQQLRMTSTKIETYNEVDEKPEMSIEMPKSIYNLKTRIFSSDDPVTVRRTDFEVTGSNMTFDTQTRQGKFRGYVRMLIFNLNNEAPKTPEGATQ